MSHDKMEKLLKRQTLTVEYMDNLWKTCQSRSKKDDLTYEKIKTYLDELERLQGRFRETDAKLMDCKDFATTEYYKGKVPAETLDKYVDKGISHFRVTMQALHTRGRIHTSRIFILISVAAVSEYRISSRFNVRETSLT